jgi:hypothetical protein
MVSRGHTLHDLVCVYPISTLNDLIKAARHNDRDSAVLATNGVMAAVMQGMDAAFNKGKGKIMKKYMDKMYPSKSKGSGDAAKQLLNLFGTKQ